MTQHSAMIAELSSEKFTEILAASSRKARKIYYSRYRLRAVASTRAVLQRRSTDWCNQQLQANIVQHGDDELAEEILRHWLLGQTGLLSAALDHLQIPHVLGITDSHEVEKIATLQGSQLQDLVDVLLQVAAVDDVLIYLKFMGASEHLSHLNLS